MTELLVRPDALPRMTRDYLLHAVRRDPGSFPGLTRCRDCVRGVPVMEGTVRCLRRREMKGAEWFCADGEKRKEEEC